MQSHTLNIFAFFLLIFHKMILFIYGSLGSFQECWPWKELKDRYPHGVSILQMWMTSKVFWTRSHTGCGPPRSQTPVFSPYSWPLCQPTSGPPRLYFTEYLFYNKITPKHILHWLEHSENWKEWQRLRRCLNVCLFVCFN